MIVIKTIIAHGITEQTPLRNKLHSFKCFQEKPRRETVVVWTEERREKLGKYRDMEEKEKGRKQLKQT